jgi:hypothetical protein
MQRRPIGQNPWHRDTRSPGPLGVNDAASPFSGLPGPTPGPSGVNDESPGCNLGTSLMLMDADDSGGGSSGAGACPDVEIEINNTPTTTDDLVLLQYAISTMKPVTPCRIRAKNKKNGSFTVVLTSPDGRIHFTGNNNTLTIKVPGGGVDWAEFEITGLKGSDKLADAIIEAHCDSDTGPLVGKKAVTVVWFDASMAVQPDGSYSINGNDFNAKAKAVTLDAIAAIRPKGVNCSAPQIVDLRVGIIQNSLPFSGGGRKRTALYGSPEVYWLPAIPIDKQVQVPDRWQLNFEYTSASNDSTSGSDPLYNVPEAARRPLDFDKDLAKPGGCGTGKTESRDNPGTFLGSGAQIWVRVSDGSGKGNAPAKEPVVDDMGKPIRADSDPAVIGGKGDTLGWVKYEAFNATLQQSFMDWVVIINGKTKEFICLRQRGWSLDVDSGKKAIADSADKDATALPIIKGAFSNQINDDSKNWKTGPVPGKMVPKTKNPKSKTTDLSLEMPVGIPPVGTP